MNALSEELSPVGQVAFPTNGWILTVLNVPPALPSPFTRQPLVVWLTMSHQNHLLPAPKAITVQVPSLFP